MSTSRRETIAEFATRAGVSRRTIERDLAAGLPYATDDAGRVVIDVAVGLAWRRTNRAAGRGVGIPGPLLSARQRREAARAGLAELKLARLEGRVIHVDDHTKVLTHAYTLVRAGLLSFPGRAAVAAFGAASREEAEARIQPLVDEILEAVADPRAASRAARKHDETERCDPTSWRRD